MKMYSLYRLPQLFDLILYIDARTILRVEISKGVGRVKDEISIITANEIMKALLTSVFPTRIKEADSRFPLLFILGKDIGDL